MSNLPISGATTTAPQSTDVIPLARNGSSQAYNATVGSLLEGVPNSALATALTALIISLPTAPSSSGPTLWNNNGLITYS